MLKVTDGEKGLMRLKQQLYNIQACVLGSPVILVGTHADQNTKVTWQSIVAMGFVTMGIAAVSNCYCK